MPEGYTWDTPPSATAAPDRLKVATCQFPVGHDIAANTREIVSLVAQSARAGADVAHFPECALSGYGPEAWPDWTGFDWSALEDARDRLCTAARQHDIWIVAGTNHRNAPGLRPSNAVLDAMDRLHRVAYVLPSLMGLFAAVNAGLAMTTIGRSALLPGMRILGTAEGFPALPDIVLTLERTPRERSAAVEALADHIVESFRSELHDPRIPPKDVPERWRRAGE